MNSVMIHSAFGLWPMLEYELDIVQRELDEGSRVVFLYCRGNQTVCGANNPRLNQQFLARYCTECRSRVHNGLAWLKSESGFLKEVEYECLSIEQEAEVAELMVKLEQAEKTEEALKPLVNLNGVDIFQSAFSSLMTNVRESEPDLAQHWERLKHYLRTGLCSYFSAQNHLDRWKPDKVYLYNARMSRYRPLLRLVQEKGIEAVVYEYPKTAFENYLTTRNTYPHDIANFSWQLHELVEKSSLDSVEVLKRGQAWFEARLNRTKQGFKPIFVEKQSVGHLPKGWDEKAFNMTFFVSSQDEMSSIEENVKDLPYGQPEAVRRIMAEFPDIHLYVRIHPNLANVDRKFVESLMALGMLEGVFVLLPESPVDTYALMQASDLVLTFGSTVGVEAAFQKKPVLRIGVAVYQAFGCTALARSHPEMIGLIKAARHGDYSGFPDEEQRYEGACAYAYAVMNFGVKPKYLQKDSYFGGRMVRNGIRTEIKANPWIRISNRLLDSPPKLLSGVRDVLSDREKKAKFINSPLTKIVNRIFGELPR